MKSVIKCNIKGRDRRKDFPQEALQPGPEFFNGIEIWGVWWKEQKSASSILGSEKQPLFGMERSIVHYNHGSLFQRRQKLVGKPEFKKLAVHRSVILKRCKNPVTYLSGDNTAALILSTTNLSKHLLAPRRVPIFSIQVCIYPAFIHIRNLFRRYILGFFLIRRCFLPILLLVANRLFSCDLIPPQCVTNTAFAASKTPRPFPTGTRPGVLPHTPSIFSVQLFLAQIPVSFICFSHFCIVDFDTLKT